MPPRDNSRPYVLLKTTQLHVLELKVNDYVCAGYTPCGGIVIDRLHYIQAMFRPVHNKPEVGAGNESSVQPTRTKRRSAAKRPVPRGD